MFELKYKITEADMNKVNKSLMWQYFIPYLAVALLGLGAGIAAVVVNVRTDVLVLGIVLIVLGAILLACTVLLLIAPKNFVVSALVTSDTVERTVKIGEERIDIETPDQENIELSYGEIIKLKNKKTHILAYVGKDIVLMIKSEDGNIDEVYNYIYSKMQVVSPIDANAEAPKEAAIPADVKSEDTKSEEHTEQVTEEPEVKKEEVKENATAAEEEVKAEEQSEEEPQEVKAQTEEKAEESKEKKPTAKKSTGKKKSSAK